MNLTPTETAKLIQFFKGNDIIQAGVFGSVARGEATEQSDIDLLVTFKTSKSLLFQVRLEREMSDLLGKKVDLLTEIAISPYLRSRIKNELQVIYEA